LSAAGGGGADGLPWSLQLLQGLLLLFLLPGGVVEGNGNYSSLRLKKMNDLLSLTVLFRTDVAMDPAVVLLTGIRAIDNQRAAFNAKFSVAIATRAGDGGTR